MINPFSQKPLHNAFVSLGLAMALTCPTYSPAFAAPNSIPLEMTSYTARPSGMSGEISMLGTVKVAPENAKISLNLRNASVRDVLSMLARQANCNVILDNNIKDDLKLTIDIRNVSINKALEYILKVTDMTYAKDGNTILVAMNADAATKNFNAQIFKTIPVLYKDANVIATQLNKTVFSIARPGGSGKAIASADPDSNSLLLLGTANDIRLVNQALATLDRPRRRKVYTIRYNDPVVVAQTLAADLFGTAGAPSASSASAATTTAAPATSAPAAPAAPTSSSGSATGGTSSTTPAASAGSAPAAASSTPVTGPASVVLTTNGVTFIGDRLASNLTVMGSVEQLAMVDSLIRKVDIRRPQVNIEISLVELQNTDTKKFLPQIGTINLGQWNLNLLPSNGDTNNIFSWAKNAQTKGVPSVSSFSIQNQYDTIKGKVLANPNVVALDGTSSTIDITDQVPSITQTTTVSAGVSVITTNITTQAAGVTLTVTPKITNDGSVTLNLTPTVSQPTRQIQSGTASTFLLSQRSVTLSAVRVRDGQTLVIGGLLREVQSDDVRKIPGLSTLPIVGAMFRAANAYQKDRTELVLLVTPHILKEDATFTSPETLEGPPEAGSIFPTSIHSAQKTNFPAAKPPVRSASVNPTAAHSNNTRILPLQGQAMLELTDPERSAQEIRK